MNIARGGTVLDSVSLKEELINIVENIKDEQTLPNVIAELIQRRKLNTVIFDLYDYDEGYRLSFHKFGCPEISHGQFSYGVCILDYVTDGQIPFEIFDLLHNYKHFRIFYDGHIFCQLRIHFKDRKNVYSHFVLLKPSFLTIDAECVLNCKKNRRLSFEMERARLINHYSPDLCLDPNPAVADIIFAKELNQKPFITPYLRHFIRTEKARREKGVTKMAENVKNYSKFAEPKEAFENDLNSILKNPSTQEDELSNIISSMRDKPSIVPYLNSRKVCLPDKESFTGSHVEIENFVFEYYVFTKAKEFKAISDKLCIGVLDDKEYYYGAFKLDERMDNWAPFYWWPIGSREDLDIHINAITMERRNLCRVEMEITHNRLFDEQVEFSYGELKTLRLKLENPVSQVILLNRRPAPQVGNEEGVQEN